MDPSATSTTVTGTVGERLQTGTEDAPVLDHSAPIRRFRDSGAGYKYPDLLTYLLTYLPLCHATNHSVHLIQERRNKCDATEAARDERICPKKIFQSDVRSSCIHFRRYTALYGLVLYTVRTRSEKLHAPAFSVIVLVHENYTATAERDVQAVRTSNGSRQTNTPKAVLWYGWPVC